MINIYQYKYFELRSELRNRNFRFARYDGNNYEELKNYLLEASPNTDIWEEKYLQRNKCYSYSGRDFSFQEIHEWDMRACIASNPFIIENGSCSPISMSYDEAVNYLKQSRYNRVFAYDSLTDLFSYDNENNCFLIFNTEHHRG